MKKWLILIIVLVIIILGYFLLINLDKSETVEFFAEYRIEEGERLGAMQSWSRTDNLFF